MLSSATYLDSGHGGSNLSSEALSLFCPATFTNASRDIPLLSQGNQEIKPLACPGLWLFQPCSCNLILLVIAYSSWDYVRVGTQRAVNGEPRHVAWPQTGRAAASWQLQLHLGRFQPQLSDLLPAMWTRLIPGIQSCITVEINRLLHTSKGYPKGCLGGHSHKPSLCPLSKSCKFPCSLQHLHKSIGLQPRWKPHFHDSPTISRALRWSLGWFHSPIGLCHYKVV